MQNGDCRMQKGSQTGTGSGLPSATRRTSGERDIQQRTFAFAVRVVRLVSALPRSEAAAVIGRQLLRSGTSIGANVEEAEAAQSRAEFIRRMNISRSEAREAHYWLRLLAESRMLPAASLSSILPECSELVSILTAIVKNTRRRAAQEGR